MLNHGTYDIINGDFKTAKEKESLWEISIGLNKVDGLEPSNYLIKLTKDSIEGRKSYKEIEEDLNKYYKNINLNDDKLVANRECDIVSTRIMEILTDQSFTFSPVYLKTIHRTLFNGVFQGKLANYVGEFRDFNITKKEEILNGDTVIYGNYTDIIEYLKYDFEGEKAVNYSKLSLEQQIKRLSKFTSAIWQIHPFCEGNTRTIAVFIQKYLISMGWDVNNDMFKENSLYFRNALVLSNYSNMKNNVAVNFDYLNSFYNELIGKKKNELLDMKAVNQ